MLMPLVRLSLSRMNNEENANIDKNTIKYSSVTKSHNRHHNHIIYNRRYQLRSKTQKGKKLTAQFGSTTSVVPSPSP